LHTCHHRTQVQTWMRLAGQRVPAIYGPSGDVTWDEADPTYSLEATKRDGGTAIQPRSAVHETTPPKKVTPTDFGPTGGSARSVTFRTDLHPGDIGAIVHLHGTLYAREYGFDHTFEAYVAGPLSDFACAGSPRERLWIAERDGKIVGCIAIVASQPSPPPISQGKKGGTVAQLRWYLVDPSARGLGLGKKLLEQAIVFCEEQGYQSIILWTVRALAAAAHLYQSVGFRKVEEKPGRHWGVDVVEEKYELKLT